MSTARRSRSSGGTRAVATLAGLVAIAAVTWWWWSVSRGDVEPLVAGTAANASGPGAASEHESRDGGRDGDQHVRGLAGELAAEPGRVAAPGGDAAAPMLAVRAVDAFGDAVAGAEVVVTAGDGSPHACPPTREDGTAATPWPGARAFVRARHPDAGTSVGLWLERDGDGGRSVQELRLLRPVEIRGVVLGPDAARVPHAVVVVEETWKNESAVATSAWRQVTADAAGAFVLEALLGADVRLLHRAPYGDAVARCVPTAATDVVLAHAGAFCVFGDCVDGAGAPVAASVRVLAPGNGEPYRRTGPRELSGGVSPFRIVVPGPGEYDVAAVAADRMSRTVRVQLSLEQPRLSLTVSMRDTAVTRGTVVDAGGQPSGPAGISAEPVDGGWEHQHTLALDGKFALPLPAATKWRLRVTSGDSPEVEVRAGDQHVRLRVSRDDSPASQAPSATGLAERAGEEVVRHVEVLTANLRPAVFPWMQWLDRTASGYERAGAGAGDDHRFVVRCSTTRPRRLLGAIDAVTNQTGFAWIEPGSSGPLRIVLQPPVPMTVEVRRDGRVPRGVHVVVEACGLAVHARADRDGRAAFDAVAHGPAIVLVMRGREVLATRDVEVPAAAAAVPFAVTIDVPR